MKKITIIFSVFLGLLLTSFLPDIAHAKFGLGLPGVIKEHVKELDKKVKEKERSEGDEPPMEIETRSGVLEITEGSTLQEEDLKVVTFAASAGIEQNGNFSVKAPEAKKYQILFFNSKTSDNPVYLGLYNPSTNATAANDISTALSLTLFNPYLIYTNQTQREEYLQAVQQNSKFSQLLSLLRDAYRTDANTALDYETNPTIYQLAAQLMKETMENLDDKLQKSPVLRELQRIPALGSPPYIEDVSGDDIKFVNPRHVWYAAGVYPNAGNLSDVATIDRKQTILSFNWGWPPVVTTDPEETNYTLGDGYFKLYLTKGIDFTKITQWNDPAGRATILNSGQVILYIVELIVGYLPIPDLSRLPLYLHISGERIAQLSLDIAQGNVEKFLIHFCNLITDNSEGIAYWIWQEYQSDVAVHQFISKAADILKKVTLVFELLGYVNEQVPFLGDLIFAPKDVTYFITQQNGAITSTEKNDPPEAEFSISPPAGVVETQFTFNASSTTDDNDNISNLGYRWDWESDGTWDTNWSSSYSATHSYSEADAYSVTLEVRDSGDLVGSVVHTLNVGGGAGTATHIKLFRDNLPWNSNAMVSMLENLGFSEGTGPTTYEIITSDQMSSVSLDPGEDLVIISNDQNQAFYDNYSAVQVRFTNFVYMGGVMLWEACDRGWAKGSIAEAGIVLPGNLITNFDYDYWNYITDQNLPLVSGLPNSMDHKYASHESFSNLPDGTTVYCVNEESEPTLIEFNLGGGWVIVTGQPLEHQYDRVYGSSDMEELLPRIVSYFTGQPITQSIAKRSVKKSVVKPERPSHEIK